MVGYEVLIADSVDDYLSGLSAAEREKIVKRLRLLEENPRSAGEFRGKFWILKVGQAGYRLAFRILEEEKQIRVTNIARRKSLEYREFYD
ncbi:hypothetical protein HYS54_05060 [Candidatus Micrarchaeota archaeon]|nr:hypothetical protein [Candidatus Micrarchaeota archaeon]